MPKVRCAQKTSPYHKQGIDSTEQRAYQGLSERCSTGYGRIEMFDYTEVRVSSYNADGKTVAALEVFDCVSGKTVSFCRRRPFESRAAWVERAMKDASRNFQVASA